MKRACLLCLQEYRYQFVEKYAHELNLCAHCQNVIRDIAKQSHRF